MLWINSYLPIKCWDLFRGEGIQTTVCPWSYTRAVLLTCHPSPPPLSHPTTSCSPQWLLLHLRASPWSLDTQVLCGVVSQTASHTFHQSLGEMQATPHPPLLSLSCCDCMQPTDGNSKVIGCPGFRLHLSTRAQSQAEHPWQKNNSRNQKFN